MYPFSYVQARSSQSVNTPSNHRNSEEEIAWLPDVLGVVHDSVFATHEHTVPVAVTTGLTTDISIVLVALRPPGSAAITSNVAVPAPTGTIDRVLLATAADATSGSTGPTCL